MTTLTIGLHNVGPHSDLTIKLAPGVNVLRGRNGIGKSTAIDAVVAALGGTEPVTVRDGAVAGRVYVDGELVLSVGKRLTRNGHPSVELAGYSSIGDVIDPGIIDPVKADAARLKAILKMQPVPMTKDALLALAGGLEWLAPPSTVPNALAAAEAIRKAANEAALAEERSATTEKAAADVHARELAALRDATSVSEREAEERRDAARLAYQKAQMSYDNRQVTQRRIAEIRATLGERPDDVAVRSELNGLAGVKNAIHASVERLERELLNARNALTDCARKESDAVKQLAAIEREQKAWDERKALMEAPIAGATGEEVDAALAAFNKADELVSDARMSAKHRAAAEAVTKHLEESERFAQKAKALREIVRMLPERLGALLPKELAQFEMEDGRLFVTLDGKRQLFGERLSFGQRARVALGVALRSFKGRVVPLDPVFWSALDPKTQRELASIAEEMGVVLVTEQPSDDESVTVETVR